MQQAPKAEFLGKRRYYRRDGQEYGHGVNGGMVGEHGQDGVLLNLLIAEFPTDGNGDGRGERGQSVSGEGIDEGALE